MIYDKLKQFLFSGSIIAKIADSQFNNNYSMAKCMSFKGTHFYIKFFFQVHPSKSPTSDKKPLTMKL